MTLIELSNKTNQPVEKLKDVILEKFGIIILSEYNMVQDNIVDFFISNASDNNNNSNNSSNKSKSSTSENSRCLDELIAIQHPLLAYTKKLLQYCIENKFLFFIDTCSLLNDNFYDFYDLFLTQKGGSSICLYIPYVVTEELKKIIFDNKKEKEIKEKAINVLRFIGEEEKKLNIIRVGNEDDKRANERGEKVIHADRVIIEKLIFFRNDSRSSLFITQDYDATVDALKQNEWHSTKTKAFILVKKIVSGGALVDNAKETVNPTLPID